LIVMMVTLPDRLFNKESVVNEVEAIF
jgi:hypothetical protein